MTKKSVHTKFTSPSSRISKPKRTFRHHKVYDETQNSVSFSFQLVAPPYQYIISSRLRGMPQTLDLSTLHLAFHPGDKRLSIVDNSKKNDFKSFGRQLLEYQGWSYGKGLGKNLQGDPSCVKKRLKPNTIGLGGGKNFNIDFTRVVNDFDSCFSGNDSSSSDDSSDSETDKRPRYRKGKLCVLSYQKRASLHAGLGRTKLSSIAI